MGAGLLAWLECVGLCMEESAIQAFRGQHPRSPVAKKVAKVGSTASSRSASGFMQFKTSETFIQW